MRKFGLVAEGFTDIQVLESVLFSFFEEDDIVAEPLRPNRLAKQDGGWTKVMKYLRDDAKDFLENNPKAILIVQIDTDISTEVGFDVSHPKNDDGDVDVEELLKQVRARLVQEINYNYEIYELHKERIIFAISMHSIECWLLLVYTETENFDDCFTELVTAVQSNDVLAKYPDLQRLRKLKNGNKSFKDYQNLSSPLSNSAILDSCAKKNPSLQDFANQIQAITN